MSRLGRALALCLRACDGAALLAADACARATALHCLPLTRAPQPAASALDDCGVCGGFNKNKGCDVRCARIWRRCAALLPSHAAHRACASFRRSRSVGICRVCASATRSWTAAAGAARWASAGATGCASAYALRRRRRRSRPAPRRRRSRGRCLRPRQRSAAHRRRSRRAAHAAPAAGLLRAARRSTLPAKRLHTCAGRRSRSSRGSRSNVRAAHCAVLAVLAVRFRSCAHVPLAGCLADAAPTRTAPQPRGNGGFSPWWSG
jgi:hypothetical protein